MREQQRIQRKKAGLPEYGPSPRPTLDAEQDQQNLVAVVEEGLASEGQPLDSTTRAFMEPRFGHDFSQVRVHTDDRAVESSQALDALAYTVGPDLVFDAGQYAPETDAGQQLIAHELAHVTQQEEGPVAGMPLVPGLVLGEPGGAAEHAAEHAATQVLDIPQPEEASPAALNPIAVPVEEEEALPLEPVPAIEELAGSAAPVIQRKAAGKLLPEDDEELRRRLREQVEQRLNGGAPTDTLETAPVAEQVPDVAATLPDTQPALQTELPSEIIQPELPAPDLDIAAPPVAEQAIEQGNEQLDGAATPLDPALADGPLHGEEPQSGSATAPTGPAISAATPPAAPPQGAAAPATPAPAADGPAPAAPGASVSTSATPGGAAPGAALAAPAASGAGDRAPASPEEDPGFQTAVGQVKTAAAGQQTHDPAAKKTSEAQAAAEMPAEERKGKAQGAQAGKIATAAAAQEAETTDGSAPGFDKEAFKAAIKQKIEAQTPSDPKKFEDFKSNNNLDQVKGEVGGMVDQGKQQAQGPVGPAIKEQPDTAAVPEKPVTPLAPSEAGAPPSGIESGKAAPKPKGQSELEAPLQEESQKLDKQMADAEITEPQLAESNEPAFQDALASKKDAQTHATEDPPGYRANEQGQIAQAESEAINTEQAQSQAMFDQRTTVLGGVDTLQADTKTGDEAKRREIGDQINAIYERTKTAVDERLARLDKDVDAAFESGTAAARAAFTEHVDRETTAYKEKRYAGAGGLLTAAWDWLTDMPEEYYQIYRDGRDIYVTEMDKALDTIATIVGTALGEAKQIVTDGRAEIDEFVASQPDALRDIAQQAAGNIQGKFDELEQGIAAKEQQLIDSLAQRYSENLKALDAEIAAIREANKGFLTKAWEATAGVIQTIMELKNMLLGVLASAADAIGAIIAAPIEFVGNLISSAVGGLENFVSNIVTHLQTGFIEWLTGTVGGAGIRIPENFDLPGIFDLTMQVLGLTYDDVRSRAVGIFGERVVKALETGFEIFVILATEGLPGLWEWIKEQLGNLKEMVLDGIQEMLITEVIEAGVQWIIGLLGGPAGAFIKACKMIYDVVMWFINNGSRLMGLINAILDSVRAIAAGDLGGAKQFVEDALARAVPTAIGFLASLIGLGDLSQKVRKIIDKVQEPINAGIDKVLNMVKDFVQKIARMLGFGDEAGAEGEGGIGKEVAFTAGDESHKLWVDVQGSQATLMVASEQMTVEQRLADWESRLGTLDKEKGGRAENLIKQAHTLAHSTNQDAGMLASKKDAIKKIEDGDPLQQAEDRVEQGQGSLARALEQLFELFGDGDTDLVAKFLNDINKTDAHAQRHIIEELQTNSDTYQTYDQWNPVLEALKKSSSMRPLIDEPLEQSHDFGMAAHTDQFVPALTEARQSASLEMSTEESSPSNRSIGQYRRRVHEGQGEYGKAKQSLQEQVFEAVQKTKATIALKSAFIQALDDKEHMEFEPVILDVVYNTDKTQRTITFEYHFQDDLGTTKRMLFTCVQDLNDYTIKSVSGDNLTLKPIPGRGVTEEAATHQKNQGFNNAHLIADWFGGSGYKQSLNLITTSATFNQEEMGSVENDIATIVAKDDRIISFDMHIIVEWGEFLEEDGEKRMKEMIAKDIASRKADDPEESRIDRIEEFIAHSRKMKDVPIKRCEEVTYMVAFKDSSETYIGGFTDTIGPDKWISISK